MFDVLVLVASLCIAALGAFLLLLSITFGSGGFGGEAVQDEGLLQALTAVVTFAPGALMLVPGRLRPAVPLVQLLLMAVVLRLG